MTNKIHPQKLAKDIVNKIELSIKNINEEDLTHWLTDLHVDLYLEINRRKDELKTELIEEQYDSISYTLGDKFDCIEPKVSELIIEKEVISQELDKYDISIFKGVLRQESRHALSFSSVCSFLCGKRLYRHLYRKKTLKNMFNMTPKEYANTVQGFRLRINEYNQEINSLKKLAKENTKKVDYLDKKTQSLCILSKAIESFTKKRLVVSNYSA
jgi:hypothetical protein